MLKASWHACSHNFLSITEGDRIATSTRGESRKAAKQQPAKTEDPEKPGKKRLIRNVGRTLKLAWEASPGGLMLNAAFALFTALIPPATTWAGSVLMNVVAGDDNLVASDLILPIASLATLTAAQRILGTIQGVREHLFAQKVGIHAERKFVDHAGGVDLGHFDNSDWHDRVKRAREGIFHRPRTLIQTILGLGGYFVTLAGMITLLVTVGPILVALALLSVIPTLTVQRKVTKAIYDFFFNRTPEQRERHYLSNLLSEPEHSKEVRAYVLKDYLVTRYHDKATELFGEEQKLYRRLERSQLLSGLVSGAILATAYWFVGSRMLEGNVQPGDILIIMNSMTQIAGYVGAVTSSVVRIEENARFLDDYFSFLQVEPLVHVRENPVKLPSRLAGGIEFDNVQFTYPRGVHKALNGLNLQINEGELMALVGENGAGKTSMIKLLMRFYDPDEGAIRVGGVDLRDCDPHDLRSRIGILFQDFAKYQLSARDNVGFGRVEREATDQAVNSAMEAARAKWLVTKLTAGLDSKVGRLFEGGQDLSGGEWQRLALARLMFRDADIWILDEPTSALDPEAEAGIFAELKENLKGRIGIVISHRFSTVRIADRIAVVRDGQVEEVGTHEELLANRARYAELFELQAAGYR